MSTYQENVIFQVEINKPALRNRKSKYPMVNVKEALSIVLNNSKIEPEIEEVDVLQSVRRTLARNAYAQDNLPPFPASIKDGYAVISTDGAGLRTVKKAVAAGDSPENRDSIIPLQPGEIVRISTGAPVPYGADAVVQVEDTQLLKCSPDGTEELEVLISIPPTKGQDIRPIGSDIKAGELILKKGEQISAGICGVLATIGLTKVPVYKQPKIGIISTGNELQPPNEKLQAGHIRDSNKTSLICLLREYNFIGRDYGIAKDK